MERRKSDNKPIRRPKGLYSKRIVRQLLFLTTVFTVLILVVFVATGGNEPSTLVEYWYKFVTGELLAIAGIKISKVIKGDEDYG